MVAALADPPAEGVLSLDLSMHDAIAVSTEGGVPQWEFNGASGYRHTGQHASPIFTTPAWQFRCADGAYVVALTHLLQRPPVRLPGGDVRYPRLSAQLARRALRHGRAASAPDAGHRGLYRRLLPPVPGSVRHGRSAKAPAAVVQGAAPRTRSPRTRTCTPGGSTSASSSSRASRSTGPGWPGRASRRRCWTPADPGGPARRRPRGHRPHSRRGSIMRIGYVLPNSWGLADPRDDVELAVLAEHSGLARYGSVITSFTSTSSRNGSARATTTTR